MEICTYSKFGVNMFPELIARGFPAVFWGGAWRAHADNIETWMQWATLPAGLHQDIEKNDDA